MKMQSEKQLTSSGKTQVALPAETRNSGLWHLSKLIIAANLLAKLLPRNLAPAAKAQHLQAAKQQLQKKLLLLKNPNNPDWLETRIKKTSLFLQEVFLLENQHDIFIFYMLKKHSRILGFPLHSAVCDALIFLNAIRILQAIFLHNFHYANSGRMNVKNSLPD